MRMGKLSLTLMETAKATEQPRTARNSSKMKKTESTRMMMARGRKIPTRRRSFKPYKNRREAADQGILMQVFLFKFS